MAIIAVAHILNLLSFDFQIFLVGFDLFSESSFEIFVCLAVDNVNCVVYHVLFLFELAGMNYH